MKTAVAIGDERRLAGYVLAGASVRHAVTREEAEAALSALDHDIGLLVLTAEAREALAGTLAERDDLVWAVLPS
jgi:vacuolar-type H+-ATPase subunit F/Vma7